MNNRLTIGLIIALFAGHSASAFGQVTEALNPINGHLYRLVENPQRTWEEASSIAAALAVQGVAGHLATITSADEQAFIQSAFGSPVGPSQIWLGGLQPTGSAEPAGGWQWVTGEPFNYANWRQPSEPNNNGDENHLAMFRNDATWNDVGALDNLGRTSRHAYLVEFAIPEPSAVGLACLALVAGGLIRKRPRF